MVEEKKIGRADVRIDRTLQEDGVILAYVPHSGGANDSHTWEVNEKVGLALQALAEVLLGGDLGEFDGIEEPAFGDGDVELIAAAISDAVAQSEKRT